MTINSRGEYTEWFARFASASSSAPIRPREWQEALAQDDEPRSRLIRIPTGYGKTLGVFGAWLYHRVERRDSRWPRRLVWMLPMRVLVEQTADEIRKCLDRLDLLWRPAGDHRGKVGVHLLMGGADAGGAWNLYPDENAVFVATQDMALSRALNRGYGAPRARWPMEFGLLNHDALWVLDEVQLMDVGLATSAQLQGFFDADAAAGRSLRPRLSWWMSATLQPTWLESVDTATYLPAWTSRPTTLTADGLLSGLSAIDKSLQVEDIPLGDLDAFAGLIQDAHLKAPKDGNHGRITLVICNTVQRAAQTFEAVEKLGVTSDLRLVHSRYRPSERVAWKEAFLGRAACRQGVDRIIIATQVVEAGVDISATTLVTELAPWSSLVQRFGRCARYDGSGHVVVVDRGCDEKTAAPYSLDELQAARYAVDAIQADEKNVGIRSIEAFEQQLNDDRRQRLYPYQPRQLLLRRELEELFDTTPDLTGADIDISSFIRSGDERDVSVFWVDIPPHKKGEPAPLPAKGRRPAREELCSVPFLAARDWLCGKATKEKPAPRLLSRCRAWVWDWLEGEWRGVERAALIPGAVVCVAADTGGYRNDRGFEPESRVPVNVITPPLQEAQDAADSLEDSEELSASGYQTIATHNGEVGHLARQIAASLVPERLVEVIELAGRWHDIGKSHPAFQTIIEVRGPYQTRVDLAKAPDGAWQKPCMYRSNDGEVRRGFRHELASCLALFAVLMRYEPTHQALLGPWVEVLALMGQGEVLAPSRGGVDPTDIEKQVLACNAEEFDLLAYLVLSHHGKVRVALHAGPKDQEYVVRDGRGLPIRGVREGDSLPEVSPDGVRSIPPLVLTLAPAALGLSPLTGRSWRDRTTALLRRHGPGALAYLEALLIAADRRASSSPTVDPILASEATGKTL
jgi:CRISPR-associated endonuclease/helicase Cas3